MGKNILIFSDSVKPALMTNILKKTGYFFMKIDYLKKRDMKERRFTQYLMRKRHAGVVSADKAGIQQNPDPHIDQDFPGYPHGTASKAWINPKTAHDKKVVGIDRHPKNSSGSTITSTSKDKN